MLSRIHQKLGTAGFIIAIIALVAAMTGGAFAALSSSDKKFIKKEAKKFSKQYAQQFAVPGPAGANGTNGTNGAPGAPGAAGKDGKNGKNIVVGEATVGECPNGGTTVQVEGEPATKEAICNGEDGEAGSGGTLPAGEILTGAYSTGWGSNKTVASVGTWEPKTAAEGGAEGQLYEPEQYVSLSFNTPLAATPTVAWLTKGETATVPGSTAELSDCKGTKEEPKPDPGVLCVYVWQTGGELITDEEASISKKLVTRFGAAINADFSPLGLNSGTWAVKAPCELGEEEVNVEAGDPAEVVEVICQPEA
ncbi:MAG TPA: hypothetical protein VLI94_00310 [Solirubrobacterales bacterium]|nr:hypothetical protein [Solirubrobacterales bacterium]